MYILSQGTQIGGNGGLPNNNNLFPTLGDL